MHTAATVTAIVDLGLAALLIRPHGTMGAVIANTVAQVMLALWAFVAVQRLKRPGVPVAELARARHAGLKYAEVGGWAVARESRCTAEGLLLALAAYSLGRILGGALGIAACLIGLAIFLVACAGFGAVFMLSIIPLILGAVGFVLSIVGPKPWLIVAVVGLSHAPRVARVMRDAALAVVERDFVKAAEATGVRRWRIMAGEILPNVTGPLMVELGLRLTYSIGLIAGLSFLGLGLQPPAADWGLMINENRVALTVQPWAVVLPVAAIAVLTIGTNLVTDGLARAYAGIDRGVAS